MSKKIIDSEGRDIHILDNIQIEPAPRPEMRCPTGEMTIDDFPPSEYGNEDDWLGEFLHRICERMRKWRGVEK